jgi:hypothetical protein
VNDATFCLSQEASIQAHLEIAKKAIASGENDLRRAADHIAEARKQGASQRRIAAAIGKAVSTVNRYLSWHDSGYRDETPFGPESKAKRQRARVRATERTNSRNRSRGEAEQDELAAVLARAKTAKAEAARAKADAAKATGEARQAKAEALKADAEAARAEAEARTARARSNNLNKQTVHNGSRALLVKALGMLGSDHAGERASAALVAEKQRAKLGMTWDELIVREHDDHSDEIDSDDDHQATKCEGEEAVA